MSADVDVVIVGAGPAGLACAADLAGLKVLLLEREERHGGRVRTIDLARQRVDMGACFAFDPSIAPARLTVPTGSLVQERADMAVWGAGKAHQGATPLGCLLRMGIDETTRHRIESVARQSSQAASMRGTLAHSLLDALLHQVHPGNLDDYDARHHRDGLFTWYPDHWEHGNGTLTDSLLAGSGAELQLGAMVTAIAKRGDRVDVDYRIGEGTGKVSCRSAVVATTAPVAASIVDWPDPRMRRFLAATRYASYLVVALGGAATRALPRFRSLVPLDGSPALVVQQRSLARDRAVLLCYYRGADCEMLASRSDAELTELSLQRLAALGIAKTALDALTESAVQRWEHAGTILSSEYRGCRSDLAERGTESIFIAGDYACQDPGAGYGLADAMRSGIHAAQRVRAMLART
ncbi:MAG TPA: FAD-dependent oxidoreductase [Burkholderiaceae bacterium]|nr:FAD-dependent oxidoreductase [Burkholderiaceae bacterium]